MPSTLISLSPHDPLPECQYPTENHPTLKDAYILVDVTARGFRLLKEWYDGNAMNYDRVYRLCIPFSPSYVTPSEYFLAKSNERIIGRLRNVQLYGHPYELITKSGEEIRTWPRKHEGTYEDIVDNGLYGEKIFTLPDLLTGLSRIEVDLLKPQQELPFEFCTSIAARYDVPFTYVWQVYRNLPSSVNPILPRYIDHIALTKQWLLNKCGAEGVDYVSLKHVELKQTDYLHDEIIHVTTMEDYLTRWYEVKLNSIRNHKSELFKNKEDPNSFIHQRSAFIRKLLFRLPVLGDNNKASFFDLTKKEKQRYVREVYGDERLLHIHAEDIGRELYLESVPVKPDYRAPEDILIDYIRKGTEEESESEEEEDEEDDTSVKKRRTKSPSRTRT